ncbi:MAG: hypothetical protein LBU78_12055 [Microbacterium sp.]|jgi:hypothetical protein|nr:hypothetical protein [Microbacterium sp.]
MAASIDAAQATELFDVLLRETASAHGEYEEEHLGGIYDEDWPSWYAAFLARALAERGYVLSSSSGR